MSPIAFLPESKPDIMSTGRSSGSFSFDAFPSRLSRDSGTTYQNPFVNIQQRELLRLEPFYRFDGFPFKRFG